MLLRLILTHEDTILGYLLHNVMQMLLNTHCLTALLKFGTLCLHLF